MVPAKMRRRLLIVANNLKQQETRHSKIICRLQQKKDPAPAKNDLVPVKKMN